MSGTREPKAKKQRSGRKGRFLFQVTMVLSLTILLNVVLTGVVFTITSRNLFANQKAGEMIPRAEAIAHWTSLYQQGSISSREFRRLMSDDGSLFDSMVHIYDAEGVLIAFTNTPESTAHAGLLVGYVDQVIRDQAPLVKTLAREIGIVVGLPVTGVDGVVTGAVFLTKPLSEFNTALDGLYRAFFISFFLVFIIMLLIAFFASRSITRPLLQMSKVARAMAEGEFTVRADEGRRDEIGQLGHSLNHLSEALSRTIGDLITERNRLRDVLNGLTEGVIAVDAEGNLNHCNPAAVRLLGGKAGEAPEGLALYPALRELLLATAADGEMREKTMLVGEATLHGVITQLQDAHEQSAGALMMLLDITEAARLEQTRRDYVANVSHELRTPIASIRGLADALNDGMVPEEADRNRYYGYILRESMRLSRLIDDLLELSRLQSGGVALSRHRLDLSRLFLELEDRFSAIAEESGLCLRLDLPEEALFAYSNEDRVEQVLVALLDNAIKYAPEGGEVVLSAARAEGKLLVSVANEGAIAEADLPHLFERFYKADKAHAGGGTGLGLAIAHEIMGLLGEKIWAENRDGKAVFAFTLQESES